MSAAGETSLPSSVEERLSNLDRLAARMRELGRPVDSFFIDPLVFPIASDGRNGLDFIRSVAAVRKQFGPSAHITGGFSNVSYGLPNRKLINEVFTWLARDAGADSGIVDPGQINGAVLDALDSESRGFKLARALLMNEDEFGMAFISASRDGEI
jgi:5-methyltetrahydrofolate--homocysteine methyltransferase